MEKSESELNMIPPNNDKMSFEEFRQNVLGNVNESELDDNVYTLDPDTSVVCTGYDDQIEGIFYRTLRGESQITIHFVTKVFFNFFHNKILADFANKLEIDASPCDLKCTRHVKSLRCDLKSDGYTVTAEML